MSAVTSHNFTLEGYTGPGTTRTNGINFGKSCPQDGWHDLLTCSPVPCHCATAALLVIKQQVVLDSRVPAVFGSDLAVCQITMNGVLGHNFALEGYTGPGAFHHVPGAGSIT